MGRTPCCDKNGLKKGPWTQEEDQKLIDYIQAHGYGNWRTLPKNAGLQRCGKSCRLRWTNYLRPDIKRGRFSFEEEETIIQLHSILGNKWSAIAARLPGRTDNEIKNYWNTHIRKRLLRMGIDPVTHSPRLDLLDLSSLMMNSSPSLVANPTNFSRLLGLQQPLINPQLLRLASSLFSTQNHNNNAFILQNHQNPNSNPQIPNQNLPIQNQNPVQDFTIPSALPADQTTSFGTISDQFFPENLDWQQRNELFHSNPTEDHLHGSNDGYYAASSFGFQSGPSNMSTPSSSTTPLHSYSNSNSGNYNSNVYNSTTEDERESYCSSILKFDDISDILDVNDLIVYN